MIHPHHTTPIALAPPPMTHANDTLPAASPCDRSSLDRGGLRSGVTARRQQLQATEAALVAACERAALHGSGRHVLIDDRETWDRATWNRYIAAAAKLEPEYGPTLRRLLREIDQLGRLIDLPIAA